MKHAAKSLTPMSAHMQGARPDMTVAVTKGATRLLYDLGYAVIHEFTLPNGRRADLAGLDSKGRLVIVEVKSCEADFAGDHKWAEYLEYCDRFYFAVAEGFPRHILPEGEGLIVADNFGGAVLLDCVDRPLAPARRRALTLQFARHAAFRLTG